MYEKALIISRYHDDFSNPIYNAYVRGIQSQCRIIRFVDYFDQIHALGKKGFELQIENMIKKEEIELIFLFCKWRSHFRSLFYPKYCKK